MEAPTTFSPQSVLSDTFVLASYVPVPGAGILAVNSFLIRGAEPLLVDTGLAAVRDDFLHHLRSLLDLKELRWIWLTHIDADHVGNLQSVLNEAPHARVVTSFIGLAKLGLLQIPVENLYLLNPGQRLDIGDRELLAIRPATFDAPETTGFLDLSSRTLFSSDSFGALLQKPAETAMEVPADVLRQGLTTWATIDAPWLHSINRVSFQKTLDGICRMEPSRILSSHLPPARGMHLDLCRILATAPDADPFVGPDQEALLQMMSAAQVA